MSSTSSSEFVCGQHWSTNQAGYNTSYRSAFGSNPYYPTMGHPMVYCLQAPRPRNLIHRGRDRERGSPNCFVKAFRWYTKEHLPNRCKSPVKPDMTGFAAWLDVKYDQFLQDSRLGSEMYHVKLKHTFEAQKVPADEDGDLCDSCTVKRFPEKRSTPSCRYIMQPKDISRPPSTCCRPSNETIIESECAKKVVRSQSFSNVTMVLNDKKQYNASTPRDMGDSKPKCNSCRSSSKISRKQSVEVFEVAPKINCTPFGSQFDGDTATKVNAETQYAVPPNSRRDSLPSNVLERVVGCECSSHDKMRRNSNNSQRNVKLKSLRDMECQCPEQKLVSVDAQTQYVPRATTNTATQRQPNTTSFDNQTYESNLKRPIRNNQTSLPISSDQMLQCTCERKIEEELMTERGAFAQITSQTSNHFISLENETVKYPFFLKIVCADKLNNENL